MDVLVTGGAGFIGSNLVRRLAASGDAIRVIDNMSTGTLDNLQNVEGAVEIIAGDIADITAVRSAVRGVEIVFHLAALPSVARSVVDPITTHSVNVDGTLNVLLASREAGVRRIVYASSSSVYGDTPTLPKHEDMPASPMSPYAASKLAGEAYCRAFARVYGMETLSLRFFNVFGPRQDPTSQYAAVIPSFIGRMLGGDPPEIYGDGHQSRDFTFVGNAVEACILAGSAGPKGVGESFNVGCGGRTTLLDLVQAINGLLQASLQPVFSSRRPGDVRHSHADISKAERLLGYRPKISVLEGLAQTIDWCASRREAAPSAT